MDTPQVQVDGPEVIPPLPETSHTETPDVDMNGTQDSVNDSQVGNTQDTTLPDAPHAVIESNPKSTEEPTAALKKKPILQFLDFLTSPIVELVVGQGGKKTVMTAHQTLLLESPYLSEFVAAFGESGPRRIELPDESVEAFSCFLQFQYTRDYSTSQATRTEDADAIVGEIDDSGEQLLQHAQVYTLAEKLGTPALKNLAHSKIHKINSTSQGELAYARYVYTHTPINDVTIRKPVASFWATRSHVLRHEAEGEFKKLCIDVPEFCFDVLSLVLDHKERRAQDRAETESAVRGSGRKRLRTAV